MNLPKHKYLKELGLRDKPYWQFDQSLADIKKDTNYQKTGIHYSET